MSPSVLFAALLAQAGTLSTPVADPASAEARAVLVPVEATFAAIAARDASLLEPHLDPQARMTVVLERPEGGRVMRLGREDFLANLRPGATRLEEVMPHPVVAIEGDVASVFGRYVFRVDGQVSHCGANHFDMIRVDGTWTIAGITWNQRTTDCGL